MPTRCRWPPLNWCGLRPANSGASPTRSSSSATRARRSGLRDDPVHGEHLVQHLPHGHRRVQRRVRVLEDDLDALAQLARPAARSGRGRFALEQDLAGRRLVELEEQAAERALARAALADEAERSRRAGSRARRLRPRRALAADGPATGGPSRRAAGKCLVRALVSRSGTASVTQARLVRLGEAEQLGDVRARVDAGLDRVARRREEQRHPGPVAEDRAVAACDHADSQRTLAVAGVVRRVPVADGDEVAEPKAVEVAVGNAALDGDRCCCADPSACPSPSPRAGARA